MKEDDINLLEHSYEQDTMVQMPGSFLYGLLQFLQTVKESETSIGFSNMYSKSAKEVYDRERGTLEAPFLKAVEQEYEVYTTAESWFSQKPQEHVSMLGAAAMDFLMLAQKGHLGNIEDGLTIKVGEFKKEENEAIKLS